jgi:hypothetical protein
MFARLGHRAVGSSLVPRPVLSPETRPAADEATPVADLPREALPATRPAAPPREPAPSMTPATPFTVMRTPVEVASSPIPAVSRPAATPMTAAMPAREHVQIRQDTETLREVTQRVEHEFRVEPEMAPRENVAHRPPPMIPARESRRETQPMPRALQAALAPLAPRGEAPPNTVVEVCIDRIDVQAPAAPRAMTPPPAPRAAARISLDDYLSGRRRP